MNGPVLDPAFTEHDGTPRVVIALATELLLLQLDAARGDADAKCFVAIATAVMQEVADAPPDRPVACACCAQPIRRGDRCNVGIILTVVRVAFPICEQCGLTPKGLDAAVALA